MSSAKIPIDQLRWAIADALHAVSANDLPQVCVRLGLEPGDVNESFNSKRKYVYNRISNCDFPSLLTLAQSVIEEISAEALADLLADITVHAEHRVTDFTRRALLGALDGLEPLFGGLPVMDGLAILAPNWEQAGPSGALFKTLRDDVAQHYLRNPDYSNAEVLEHCGALTCSQGRFFALLEQLLHPICRTGQAQANLAEILNALLLADGFMVVPAEEVSRHPLYRVRRAIAGVSGTPKNLIFAAINAKPDLYLLDAINNDIGIRNASDALIYDRLIPEAGLTWMAMANWWRDSNNQMDLVEAKRQLYRRLAESVRGARSPGEYALFTTYYTELVPLLGERLPALIPQVYLHYDPKTASQRGANPVLARQRMDLLLLLDRGARIVIEVDGMHHFADGRSASPAKYAEMAAEDRRLRLHGYEVYRFGAAEFGDTEMVDGRFKVGERSVRTALEFFQALLLKHGVQF